MTNDELALEWRVESGEWVRFAHNDELRMTNDELTRRII